MLEISNINKWFSHSKILSDVSISISHGDFFSILGPSGCGKTTLLRIIAGFEEPDTGTLAWKGSSILGSRPHHRPFNMIFQKYALFPHLSVAGNIAFGPTVRGWDAHKIKSEVREALQLVQLDGFADRDIASLSGGQQQRVAIARAIINKPDILLLDEPLSALDRKLREQMQIDLLRIQRSLGITFIMVTHDQEEALTMSDKIAIMRQGVVEQFGSPQEIYRRPKSKFVADFIGSVNSFEYQNTSVVIRPEDLKISSIPFLESPEYSQTIEASVREILFKGAITDVILDWFQSPQQQITLIGQMISDQSYMFEVGQKVFVRWPNSCLLNL